MCFIKLAVTHYETGRPVPAIGADDIWINRHQIVAIEEHLGSDAFDPRSTRTTYYPCLQLLMSNGHHYLVPLGSYPDQATGIAALQNFLPVLLNIDQTCDNIRLR